jgi:hypothetical protein
MTDQCLRPGAAQQEQAVPEEAFLEKLAQGVQAFHRRKEWFTPEDSTAAAVTHQETDEVCVK